MSGSDPLGRLLPVSRAQRALALLLAGLAAAAVMVVSESAYRLATEASAAMLSRQTVRFEMASLMSYLDASESAQRGFLILGRDDYLKPMISRRADIEALLQKLRRHYADGQWASHVEVLTRRVNEKYGELDETIRLYRIGSHDAWRALMETEIGREKMDAVRQASERLIAFEGERIAGSREAIALALSLGRFGVHLLTLLSLIGLMVFLRRNASLVQAQKQHARELRQERDRLDREVLERTEQLTELTRYLQTVREDERAHLARELHDELGALLTTAKLDLARMLRALKGERPELHERLRHMSAAIDEGIQLKRRIIEDLRPSALSNLGLSAALEILTREFAARAGIPVHAELDELSTTPERALALYRFVQEAITNIAKYAQAKTVWVLLKSEADGACCVQVRDDGLGFDPLKPKLGRHGLVGMRYRVEALGGTLRIESKPGAGVRLEVRLPPAPPS